MNKIMARLQENYRMVEEMGYEIVGIFLQGSQNYKLDYEHSDIDCKAIVVPRLDDFVLNKKAVSTTIVLDNNEHIDLKDIRLMFETFRKQNINFVEILFTDYHILNIKYAHLFTPLMEQAEMVAHYNDFAALNCMAGMCYEKYKALEHPYPATIEKIKKFGYDPKQLHHIMRVNEFMKRYIDGESYKSCLVPKYPKFFIEVKKGAIPLAAARMLAKDLCNNTTEIKNKYLESKSKATIDKRVDTLLNSVLLNIMKEGFSNSFK